MRVALKVGIGLVVLALAGVAAGWMLAGPNRLDADELAALPQGDAAAGERVFWAGGCASCHAAEGAEGEAMLDLPGGLALKTDFGTFVAPNISSHPDDGIGAWSVEDFANAVKRGVSPEGAHYYPAFPYASYARIREKDVADLYAFMQTLPAVEGRAGEHQLGFPFNIRRGLGLWKMLYLDDAPVAVIEAESDQVAHGRYLVEGLGHCGECHTARSVLGGWERDFWLGGAPSLETDRRIPNITPADTGIGGWSATDIAYYLESGFTPDFDSAGGRMAAVVRNMARLPAEDREAIAAYLKAIPAVEGE